MSLLSPARVSVVSIGAMVAALAFVATAPAEAQQQQRRYRNRDGAALALANNDEIKEALRDGDILERERLGSGTTGVQRLELEHNGIRLRAVFRDVDSFERNIRLRDGTSYAGFYDRFSAECAAYELSLMLGLDMIPPAVIRRVGGDAGSVQLWMEDTMTEGDRATDGLRPPDAAAWRRQQSIMRTFDALIANSDRNTGNSLIDPEWNLWMIDHSRTFQIPRGDASFTTVNQLPLALWQSLRALDEDAVRDRLRDFLEPAQLTALFKRHAALVAHIEGLIEERGEEAVLTR